MDKTQKTYRIRGIAVSCDIKRLESYLADSLYPEGGEGKQIAVKSLATAANLNSQVATVDFDAEPVLFQNATNGQLTLSGKKHEIGLTNQFPENLTVDSHFRGLTPLHTAQLGDRGVARIDIIAISGLGSHAFGSFKERGESYMWIRDALGLEMPAANIWIYGFDSKVHQSKSVQTIDDLASGFVSALQEVFDCPTSSTEADQVRPTIRRLVLIGHSLGGLVIKQALIRLNKEGKSGLRILPAIRGLLFFGVPNQGMAQRSLLSMSEAGPNDYLLHTLGPVSEVLRTQREQFASCAALMNCEVHCFYETILSPTAVKDDQGRWSMSGPEECLVTRDSATHYLEGKSSYTNCHAIDASHSEMIKFRRHDATAESVFRIMANLSVEGLPEAEYTRQDEANQTNSLYNLGLQLTYAPYLERQLFKGRSQELKLLEQTLLPRSIRTDQKVIALSGLGGMGKTQLALAFAREYHHHFTAVIWLSCNTETSIRSDIVRLVTEVLDSNHTIGPGSTKDQQNIDRFRSWLSEPTNRRWLLILDNYDNPSMKSTSSVVSGAYDIRKYLPQRCHGSVLITTRSTELPYRVMPQLKQLDEQDSKNLLLQRAGRDVDEEDEDMSKLVKRLAGLPLALATAGDYLRQSPISFGTYLDSYNDLWKSSTNEGPSEYEGRTLYNTWNITFGLLDGQAKELLCFLAFFDNQDIWFELLQKAGNRLDAGNGSKWSKIVNKIKKPPKEFRFSKILETATSFHKYMRHLCSLSLVESHQSSQSYSLHACVHDWLLTRLKSQSKKSLYRLAFWCISDSYAWEITRDSWSINKRLFPHLQQLTQGLFKDVLQSDPNIIGGYEYTCAGELYRNQDKLESAEKMYIRALQGYEKALGPDHTSTLTTVNNLGVLYRDQSKLESAEQMYIRALQGREKALGPDHTSTLNTVHNLGVLYCDRGKLESAERMYTRALQGYEKALGLDHISTLHTVHNIGNLYSDQSKLESAEQMYIRALQGYEKALGPDHTLILDTVNNLGVLYYDQGKLELAEQMYIRALQGKEKALGPDYTSTLTTVNNLGNLYRDQSKLELSEQMLIRALQGKEKALGPDHTSTLDTVNNLGVLYRDQGKLELSEQMYTRALQGYEKALGPDHTLTLRVKANLQELSVIEYS